MSTPAVPTISIGLSADPVTAGFNALTTFNQFLLTAAGQKIASDFESLVAGLLDVMHVHIQSNLPAAPVVTTNAKS